MFVRCTLPFISSSFLAFLIFDSLFCVFFLHNRSSDPSFRSGTRTRPGTLRHSTAGTPCDDVLCLRVACVNVFRISVRSFLSRSSHLARALLSPRLVSLFRFTSQI
ncbi:hypothetical protein K438DRAFT_606699 [Mycena galopus ATCC 62051]|nr:hypothetical protein K438DRAFT_606699 [Mycena galopus ATCC 62051]